MDVLISVDMNGLLWRTDVIQVERQKETSALEGGGVEWLG